MRSQTEDARLALRAALGVRKKLNLGNEDSIPVYDVAEKLGLEVRFLSQMSIEGLYCKGERNLIMIPAERPPGRQAFSCAHEIGHHIFGHGALVDDLMDDASPETRFDPQERQANAFARFLLMPSHAVRTAFLVRGWDIRNARPEQVYSVASYLNVGYETLANHLRWSLEFVTKSVLDNLLTHTPKQIRRRLCGRETQGNVIQVDAHWRGRPADVQVGDLILLPQGTTAEGRCISSVQPLSLSEGINFCTALRPGIGRAENESADWAVFIRVSRKAYQGRAIFRHEEDPDAD